MTYVHDALHFPSMDAVCLQTASEESNKIPVKLELDGDIHNRWKEKNDRALVLDSEKSFLVSKQDFELQ